MDWEESGCLQHWGDVIVPTLKCFEVVFVRILSVILSIAALALFVMILISGFKLLTSGGDPKKTAAAKQTATYAIGGIVLMLLAYLVFRILEIFTGVNLLKFTIPNFV